MMVQATDKKDTGNQYQELVKLREAKRELRMMAFQQACR